jgi:NADP-dependent 3-hydroxy acid dehydrogenase YdfG
MRLEGTVAVVTGGGSGIGRAIARRLAADGAHVVVAGRRRDRLDETVRLIGPLARAIACDVADVTQVRALMDAVGGIDVLVNDAARNRPEEPVPETVAELPEDWWATTLDVNLTGAFLCCKYALPSMLASGGGAIVNVASTSGIAGNTNQGAYVASKHGLVGLTRSIALDYAGEEAGRHPRRALRAARGGGGARRLPRLGRGLVHHRRGDPDRRRHGGASRLTAGARAAARDAFSIGPRAVALASDDGRAVCITERETAARATARREPCGGLPWRRRPTSSPPRPRSAP